ncbi:hypothetical protein B5X24_HaOG206637 [Helicoverpa armigera]|nr:hypothetical protein B5X24_HaOG206637 [Helicoverpa armigera]
MESKSDQIEDHASIEDIYQVAELASTSSEGSIYDDPSIRAYDESSKMKLYLEGLYSPGSGDICTKFATMSRSSMFLHQYYQYPSVKDPGIEQALLFPEGKKIYADDGQELYLDLCKEMDVIPVRMFHRQLKTKSINLKYYGVNPVGIRAMCLALASNRTVECLDLTSNFLEHLDACYHLGELLGKRTALKSLILSGCRIGFRGLQRVIVHLHSRIMTTLDVTGNNILDTGVSYIAEQIRHGAIIRRLNLGRNDLSSESCIMLAEVLEIKPVVQYLDLSWNKFVKMKGPSTLFRILSVSDVLVELNMAWTSIAVVRELGNLLGIKTLKVLNLSNNRLGSPSAHVLANRLHLAKSLQILDVSSNPFTPSDALYLLSKMRHKKVRLKQLLMDYISVSKEFGIELNEIKQLRSKRNMIVTHGDILRNYTLPERDLKGILMNRLHLVMSKMKHIDIDILLYFLEQNKTKSTLETSEFARILKQYEVPLKDDFIQEFVKAFSGSRAAAKFINLDLVVDYIRRFFPDKKLPPTPPATVVAATGTQTPLPSNKKTGKKKK